MQTLTIPIRDVKAGDVVHGLNGKFTAAGDAEIMRAGSLMGGVTIHAEDGPTIWMKCDDPTELVEVDRDTGEVSR